MQQDEVFRLSELTRYIQQVLTINFESSFWIEAEVNQISESRGNYYLELVEKDEHSDDVLAVIQARIWRSNQVLIRRKLNSEIGDYLQAGVQVKLRGSIKFHDVYGLSFQIDDIDKDFTLGELERKKLATIATLKKEGVFELNKSVELDIVVQRIAVISSRTAAGLADFINQLQYNQHDIPFQIDLYHSAVQGYRAVDDICYALDEIDTYSEYYDAVCILRGGGSKLDLSAFDDEKLCRKIGQMPIPVLTGIGHEIDLSVADMTAHSQLKTPTALAAFLIDRNVDFLSNLYNVYQRAIASAKRKLDYHNKDLQLLKSQAEHLARNTVSIQHQTVQHLAQRSEIVALRALHIIKQQLGILKASSISADPAHVLKRGFVLISQNDDIIKRSVNLDTNKNLKILFHDGKIETSII